MKTNPPVLQRWVEEQDQVVEADVLAIGPKSLQIEFNFPNETDRLKPVLSDVFSTALSLQEAQHFANPPSALIDFSRGAAGQPARTA